MQRKKRSRVASANSGTLKTGWYGIGRPFSASIPRTAERAAHRTVVSNVIGMNEGQLLSGRPPTLSGYATTEHQYWSRNPPRHPAAPPARTIFGRRPRLL